jgi:hypothetical protein
MVCAEWQEFERMIGLVRLLVRRQLMKTKRDLSVRVDQVGELVVGSKQQETLYSARVPQWSVVLFEP